MAGLDVREVTAGRERDTAFRLMGQLFTDLDREGFEAFFEDDRYHLFAGWDGEAVVGLAGVSVRPVLHHERHVWLHDLVVDEPRRGEGHGTRLLEFVEGWAAERGCDLVALPSRTERDRAHRFYEERGYDRWGYVYERRLPGDGGSG